MTLKQQPGNRSVFPFHRRLTAKGILETYANLHPMQFLGPPEKLALHRRISASGTGGRGGVMPPTGYRKPRKAIPASRSCRATVPVGIHKHLVPIGPCSCKTGK